MHNSTVRHVRWFALAGTMTALLAMPLAHAEDVGDQDAPVASVNGVEITEQDVEFAAEDLSQALENVPPQQQREHIIRYLTDLHLLSQAAREAGLEEDQEYADRLEYMAGRTLMEIYLAREGEARATEEEARELYDSVIEQAEPETEVHARHILVESEGEAERILDRLGEGEDFEELARELSVDPGSAEQGGDLGYIQQGQLVPEFGEAAFALEPGETSEPVESQFGWHVIRVEDRRESEPPSFEEVEGELMTLLARQAQREVIMELREEADIEIGGEPIEDLPAPDAMPQAPAPEVAPEALD